MERVVVTRNDLLDAVQNALRPTPENPAGALTTEALRAETGCGINTLRRVLGDLKRAGVLECVTVYEENLAGNMSPKPAYRLKGQNG